MEENQTLNQYGAFISYRHTEPDKTVAEKLHRMLENFKVPKALVRKGCPKKIGRVFRDRDELPTSSNLADNIQSALEHSGYLIVICSPRTPQSQWVLKEIETFKRLHGHDRILALLVEGEPAESFPQQLRFVTQTKMQADGTPLEEIVEVEPLAADIRDKTLSGMKKKLKGEILRLLAPILGCRYDDLKQRHRERMVKRVLTASISLSVFFLGFGSITAYQSQMIKQQAEVVRQQSEVVKEQSEQLKVQVKKTLSGQSLYLADVSKRLDEEGDRLAAILVALEALPKDLANPERPYLEEAEYALSEALAVYKNTNEFIGDMALQHDMNVNFVKLSPDGKKAVSSSQDGFLYLWDTQYGILLNKLNVGDAFIDENSFYFLDDAKAVCAKDDQIIGLDMASFQISWEQPFYSQTLAVSPDKSMVAGIMDDVLVLDAATGDVLFKSNLEEYLEDKGSDMFRHASTLRFADDGLFVLAGTSNGDTLIFDIASGSLVQHFTSPYEFVEDIALSKDGVLAIVSNYIDFDNTWSKGMGHLQLIDYASGSEMVSMPFDYSALEQVSFHPDDPNLLLFVEAEKINVFNVGDKKLDYTFISGDTVTGYLVRGDMILSSSRDGTIRNWNMRSGGFEYEPFRITMPDSIKNFDLSSGVIGLTCSESERGYIRRNLQNEDAILMSEDMGVSSACYTADGKKMVTYPYDDGDIILWDMENHQELARYPKAAGATDRELFFFDGESKLLVLDKDGHMAVLDAKDLSPLESKDIGAVYESGRNGDGSLLVIAGTSQTDIYQTSDLTVISTIPDYFSFEKAIFYPDSSKVILTSSYWKSACFEVSSGELVHEFPDEGIIDAAMSHDGSILALISKENQLRLVDPESFKEKGTLGDFNVKARRLFFHPDDKTLFVALDDRSLRRYNVKSGELVADMKGWISVVEEPLFNVALDLMAFRGESTDTRVFHDSTNKPIAFLSASGMKPDFSEVLTGKTDGSLVAVPFYSLEMLMKEAARQLGERVLTPAEKERYFIVE